MTAFRYAVSPIPARSFFTVKLELRVSLVCAVQNGRWVEYIPQLDDITGERLRFENGRAHAPETPGLGIDWDKGAIAAVPSPSSPRRSPHEAHETGHRHPRREDRQAPAGRRLARGAGQDRGVQHPQLRHLPAPENLLFASFEYHGDDWEADPAKMAAGPTTLEWRAACMPCQRLLDSRAEGEWWADMEEVFFHE